MASRPQRQAKKNLDLQHILTREQERHKIREIRRILKKPQFNITEEESKFLSEHACTVAEIKKRNEKRHFLSERKKEVLDSIDVLEEKCKQLANEIQSASSVVIYTGAGISTAARIPDYRGPDGVWTLLKKGETIQVPDLSIAEPTFTHMAIRQLYKSELVSHVVSQNCDGLHIRSGLPPKALSEIHGNMYIEVCTKCKPLKQYIRLFDVTENTGLHRHKTGRTCNKCGSELKDTIVHFGESGTIQWPLNWKAAAKSASKADVILCLGSSLKVLKRYHCLWSTDKPTAKRPKLYIVNLQWTPKDIKCTLKINAKCDEVMKHVMSFLDVKVPVYRKEEDPIFKMATCLTVKEKATTTRNEISPFLPSAELPSATDLLDVSNEHCYAKDFNLSGTVKCEPENSVGPTLKVELKQNDQESVSVQPALKSKDEEHADCIETKRSCTQISGWYGKGSAKWRKYKRKKL